MTPEEYAKWVPILEARVAQLNENRISISDRLEAALEERDTALLQVREINKILLGAISDTAKVIRVEGVLAKTENRKDEAGNPWAPNKDYPGKPVVETCKHPKSLTCSKCDVK